jgi:hypothetical protein
MTASLDGIADQQANSSTLVSWSFRWLDDKGSGEVAPAVSRKDQRTGQTSMCVTSHVGGDGRESDSKSDGLRIDEPEADEPAPCVRSGEVSHTRRCDGAKDIGHGRSKKTGCITVSNAHKGRVAGTYSSAH